VRAEHVEVEDGRSLDGEDEPQGAPDATFVDVLFAAARGEIADAGAGVKVGPTETGPHVLDDFADPPALLLWHGAECGEQSVPTQTLKDGFKVAGEFLGSSFGDFLFGSGMEIRCIPALP